MPSKELPTNVNDKTAHFVAFAGFSFLWLWVKNNYRLIIFIGIIYSILIEFWQGILPESFHRGFDWYDALADGIGVLIGGGLFFVSYLLVKKIID